MKRPEPTAMQIRMLGPRAAAKGMSVAEFLAWSDAEQVKADAASALKWACKLYITELGVSGERARPSCRCERAHVRRGRCLVSIAAGVTLVLDDGNRHRTRPGIDARHVVVDIRCPHGCNDPDFAPVDPEGRGSIGVRGTGITWHDHDTYYARAIATCCSRPIGNLERKTNTLFGIDEDEAVLVHGRPRVYG